MNNMSKVKNLFDFATKELSQDAFLRWFFESWEDEEMKPIVVDFINTFSKGQEENRPELQLKLDDLVGIKTFSQVNDIDVCVDIYLKELTGSKDSKEYITFVIEDKTDSEEHNQLETYSKRIKKWNYGKKSPDNCVYKLFYKTNSINDDEKDRVINNGWTPFDLIQIYDFFSKYKDKTHSDVLNDYIYHVEKLKSDLENTEIPSENNIVAWKSFFEKTVKPKIVDKCDVYINDTFFGYTYLNVRPLGCDHKTTPYLEIRSRDCLDKKLIGKILLYDVEISGDNLNDFKERIRNRSEMFHAENNSKQIGNTKRRNKSAIEWTDQDDYINKVIKMIDEYLALFDKNINKVTLEK